MKVKNKNDLIAHIKIHKSYKLCKNYAVNKCELESECRYNHDIFLRICYKCGVKSSSKTDIIKHIKTKHGNETCHNFLLNRCDYQECMFSHERSSAPSVESIPEREMATPSAPAEPDFLNQPTIALCKKIRTYFLTYKASL